MSDTAIETPAPRVFCEQQNCGKHYKTRANMLQHVRVHQNAPSQIESSLGNFPSSTLARVLFDDNDTPSTQGNSRGQINSPKVLSIVSFKCGVCDKSFETNDKAILHMKDVHKNSNRTTTPSSSILNPTPTPTSPTPTPTNPTPTPAQEDELNQEDDVLEAAKEEQDLYDEIFRLSEDFNHEKEKEAGEDIQEKLRRFRKIMTTKDTLLKEARNNVKKMITEQNVARHNYNMLKEVEERQHCELEEKKKEMEKIKKDVKTQKDKHKKEKEAIENELESVRGDNGELNKENNDLKVSRNTKDSIIKALNEASSGDDTDEVEVIDPTVSLNKDSPFHHCNACDRMFKRSQDLERHIAAKHEEKQCTYCDKMLSNEQELTKHLQECINIGVANSTCNKCNKIFTYQGLNRHKPTCLRMS